MDISFCSDCNRETEVAIDHRQGDTICTYCGLVLTSHYIDETSEWRNFDSDSTNDKDPERVGEKVNPLLDHGGGNVTTLMIMGSKSINNNKLFTSPNNNNIGSSSKLRTLSRGFDTIRVMADRLGLVTTVKDRACEIYGKLDKDSRFTCKARHLNALLAASLFVACRELKLSRTLREIASAADGVSMKEISRAIESIKKHVEVEMWGMGRPEEFARRFCSILGMNNQAINAVQEAVMKVNELDIRRSPKSVLAAIIYMISQVSGSQTSVKEIAAVAEVVELTIKKTYKDLAPYASKLIPQWYVKGKGVALLSGA